MIIITSHNLTREVDLISATATTKKTDYIAVLVAYMSFVVLGIPSAMRARIGIGVFPGIAGVLADRSSLEAILFVLFALSIMMMILYELTIRAHLGV
ncbi:MAG: hypothetical protein ABSA11_03210 [Candidatus Bathyarchaeia archaeon]